MFNLRFENDPEEFVDLVAINVALSSGEKLRCTALGCSDKSVKRYVLDKELLRAPRISVAYRQRKSDRQLACIDAVEKDLQESVDLGLQELHEFASGRPESESGKNSGKNKGSSDLASPVVRSIRIFIDDEEKMIIDRIQELPYVNLSMVVRSGGVNALGVVHGYEDTKQEQTCWFKETLDRDCNVTIEFIT